MDYKKICLNRATSLLTRKNPFLRKETSWDASERWPPSCRLQNVLIYFLEIQVIPEVEQRTIKLLSNKGHLPSTPSIKKAELSPRFSPGRDLPGQGDTQHTTCSCHEIICAPTSFWGETEILWPQMQRRNLLLSLRKMQRGKCCWEAASSTHQPTVSWWWDTPTARATNFLIFYFHLFSTVDFFLLFILCGRADSIGTMSLHRHIYLLIEEKHLCLLKLF